MSAGNAMRLKWVEDAEAHLRPEQLEVWKAVHAKLPQGHPFVGTDYGLEIFLLAQIQRGATIEVLEKFIPKRPVYRPLDRRQIASGERDVA